MRTFRKRREQKQLKEIKEKYDHKCSHDFDKSKKNSYLDKLKELHMLG